MSKRLFMKTDASEPWMLIGDVSHDKANWVRIGDAIVPHVAELYEGEVAELAFKVESLTDAEIEALPDY